MKYRFEDLKYTPTDFVSLKNEVSDLTERAKAAASSEALDDVLKTYDSSFGDVGYNYTLAYIRSSLDSSDEYWQNALQKEGKGIAMLDTSELLKAILDNEFYPALAKKYGPALSDKLQKSIATGSKAQKERAEEENLVTQYQREKAMVRVMYKGEMRSEGEISPLLNDPDRNIRVESKKALLDAFLEKKETLGNMLEKLVVLRDKIAKENGFANYLEYMNVNYSRLGYGEKEMDAFVEDVKKYVVPISSEITEETRKRLNLEEMTSLDMGLMFPDGNAKPAGGSVYLKNAASKMYRDLSPEMEEFFTGMLESNSINVDPSPNKVSGMGFCTDLKKGMYPFVFGNLDGTEWDVAVFTHEVGHAW
ncbi:MAG: hypothetical protein ACI4SL_11240, partial [Candidatus Ornithospirochaeta sp.]